ncbi:ras guanine nucleotide exchange factor domain-containing protein [Parasitella parasitica]|nr:ras guanine nucleotide exchange factor domain-containing protein [Parasitella parasitica]
MASPSLLCRVQALYSFESNDPSSLKFDEGDFIDVLTKLPSGWWDGWCNGSRGWFPSNYVTIIDEYGGTGPVSPTTTPPITATATPLPPIGPKNATRRISSQTELFDDRVGSSGNEGSKRTSLPPNWSIQNREDGSASYYFNTITGEMRSTYPYDDSGSFYEGESDEDSATSSIDSTSRSDSALEVSYLPTSEESIVSDHSLKDIQHQQQQGKWIQRTTPQGLPFFYNLSTHETAWHADSQEQQGSPKVQPRLPSNNATSPTSASAKYPFQPSPSFDNNEILTWNKLSIHITLTINNLIASAKNSQRSLYKKYAARIVEAVRFMLVASGTISKESLHIKTSNVLRSHHRAMMASMSKLVLSAQLCADGTVHDISKILADCHELLVAVRNFISTCESIPVEINNVDPHLISSPQDESKAPWDTSAIRRQNSISSTSGSVMDHGIRAKYELQPDLIEILDAYGTSMQESMESLMANLTRHSDSRCSLAVLLFTQYRNFGNQNGQFLSIIEDIDFNGVIQSPLMKDLAVAKQKLFDGLGLLFIKMQTMTDDTVPMEKATTEMQQAAQSITEAIRLVCDRMADLVNEKKGQSKVIRNTSSNRSSLLGSIDKDTSLGDFLHNATGSHDLSFDLSLSSSMTLKNPSLTSTEDLKKRSQSLSVDTAQSSDSSSTKASNRSSAPITENTPTLMAETLKNRAHTLTETQSKHTSAKLKQFFGDDLPDPNASSSDTAPTSPSEIPIGGANASGQGPRKVSATPSNVSANTAGSLQEDEQRYLQYDYSANEIVFTVEGTVKGGTLRALVERMTLHDYLDMNFNSTFLLTYRSFCTSMELLELLEARYNIQPPADLTPEELEIWVTKKQKLIRLRVFNVLKIWLEQYYYEEDSVILDRLLHFTNTSIKDTLSFSAYQLERLIQKRKEACKDLKKLVITQQQDSPDPILPKNLKKFRLLDLDAIEMARQLTLMDFKLYSSIKPVECLDKAWSRDTTPNDDHHTPVARNIQSSIDYCNQVTTWVSDEILSQSEVKRRSALIKYWVSVAERCRTLNNFNTCMAILSAFDNSAVGRLKRTWEMVGARTNHTVANIRKLMGASRNFNQYRALIHSVNPPCIPFLGIYLQDLTFIEDGNPNFLKTSKDLINFAKRAKTAEVIREIQQYQTMGYQFRAVDEIQSFILDSLHSSRDEDQLYKESLKLEPKERDDEKITRLLQESGFL